MSLRIRKKNQCHLYTIKKKIPNEKIKICKEIEHPIECVDTYKLRLDKHGLVINREKKKHRKSYKI
jgi:adenylate cyclase class IV